MRGFVLGQQSMERVIDPAKEKELASKMGKLKTYRDINEQKDESCTNLVPDKQGEKVEEGKKEKSEKEKFLEEWKNFPGYKFE